ncbi:nuclear transport factor 2 family protein [Gordonia sp. CPCC 205333]|uniref:nuclear transport factor 2 family protein n=1 Tax=Gordonia sp. CPCC 205333 TaxID=3140790 RepID=UPI003AF36B27
MTHADGTCPSPREIAELYFASWAAGDPEPLRPYLAPDVTFDGALGSTRGADEFLDGLGGMFAATTSNDVRLRLAGGTDVVTWSELRIADKAPMQVANWTHVEGGMITAVRVTFDPRPMFGE